MGEVTKIEGLERENDLLYNEKYYQNYNGDNYGRNEKWFSFFGNIADNIVEKIQPKTVLDIGCAYGLLVESLRDRGCEAFGIDVSDYAISRARADIGKYLSVNTILRPIGRKFDLIVTIEVIEHIKEEDCETAVQNMCAAADSVLLATTPDDFDDPTHFNVQPPVYWVKQFAKFGFAPDITHDAGYLTPYAILFRKSEKPMAVGIQELFGEKKLQDYYFARSNHRTNVLENEREFFESKINQLSEINKIQETAIHQASEHASNLEAIIEVERSARLDLQQLFDERSQSLSWKVTRPFRILKKLVDINLPLKPSLIEGQQDGTKSPIQVTKNVRWIMVGASGDKPREYEVSFFAKNKQNNIRLTALKLPGHAKMASWLVRVEPGHPEILLNILRGAPNDINFYHVSTSKAWRSIFSDRWRRGKGLQRAIGLIFRSYKKAINEGFGAALADFWPSNKTTIGSYDEWLLQYDGPDQHRDVKKFLGDLAYQPLISIILPTFNSNLNFLTQAIESVTGQSYPNWQLCIADDASTDKILTDYLKELENNEKISIIYRESNGHIAAATNAALSLAAGEFVVFLDHDDRLHPHALATVVAYLNKDKELDILYSDEDKIDEDGNRSAPFFKPDWSPDLLLSQNYTCHLSVYRKALIDRLDGIREGTEGAQDYDLILRATEQTEKIEHIPHVLYHWRAVEGSTALGAQEKDYAHQRAIEVLNDAIGRRNLSAEVLETGLGAYHRIRYDLPTPVPSVSVIIPTKDRIDLLSVCLNGLLNRTNYANFEILIVDNSSAEAKTFEYFEIIKKDERVRVLKFPGEFNFSAINNFAVSKASGEIIILLNNDIEVINESWLTELVSHAARPGVGAVGCRLYYPDDHVQHDGIIIGMGGVAGYAHPHSKREDSGEFGRSKVTRNYSAVTAAALAIKKSAYIEVGGLDADNLPVAFNDVDFCLKVKEAGYENVYSPFAELYHHESVSRGPDTDPVKAKRFEGEAVYMNKRWGTIIPADPFYNPNLSLRRGYEIDLERGKSGHGSKNSIHQGGRVVSRLGEFVFEIEDVRASRGLEIGALTSPIVTPNDVTDGGEIFYLDHLSTECLKEKYADDATVDIERIVEVDFVCSDGDIVKSVGGSTFDYIIASHVIEHTPNMLQFMVDLLTILKPGGRVFFIVPDKRFTFDINRPETTFGMVFESFLCKQTKPSLSAVYDHFSMATKANGHNVWHGIVDSKDKGLLISEEFAWAAAQLVHNEGKYFDVHVNVFTPASFFSILKQAVQNGIVSLKVEKFEDTKIGQIEFMVAIQKPENIDDKALCIETFPKLDIDNILSPYMPQVKSLSTALEQATNVAGKLQIEIEKLRSELYREKSEKTSLSNELTNSKQTLDRRGVKFALALLNLIHSLRKFFKK